MMPTPPARSRRYWLILVPAVWLSVELLALVMLAVLDRTKGIRYQPSTATALSPEQRDLVEKMLAGRLEYLAHSKTLGWTIKPNARLAAGLYTSNAQGLRADRELPPTPTSGMLRIAAFGDSYTHGDDVPNDETWEVHLSRLMPRSEVLNFGVPAYGVDQAYLRYQVEGVEFHPHVVLIGFMSENIHRHVNSFRPFYRPDTGLALAKPRFRLHDGRLSLVPNPLPTVQDYAALLHEDSPIWGYLLAVDPYAQLLYRACPLDRLPSVRLAKVVRWVLLQRLGDTRVIDDGLYKGSSTGFHITLKLLEAFSRKAIDHDTVPVIVLLPNCTDIAQFQKTGQTRYTPLAEAIAAHRYRLIDVMPAFEGAVPLGELCQTHYTPQGNARVAAFLKQYLERERLADPTTRAKLLREERLAREP